MSTDDPSNIFKLHDGGKPETPDQTIPTHSYVVTDVKGTDYFAEGFLLFTSHHIAIMRDTGSGAIPILVLPLDKVLAAELVDDTEATVELPF